jgi:predicted nucleic acid binding AN1-type Zn finger protein
MDKIKCNKCNKKIGLIFFDCKCTGKFCSLHRHIESHNCSYDFKSEQIEKLIKDNPKIVPQKVTII